MGRVGKAAESPRPRRNWIQEERRKILGDWVAVCLGCGFAQRYFEGSEGGLAKTCPQCLAELRARCPECGARFSSAFAVECEACGGELRPPEVLGVRIRRPPRGRQRPR